MKMINNVVFNYVLFILTHLSKWRCRHAGKMTILEPRSGAELLIKGKI